MGWSPTISQGLQLRASGVAPGCWDAVGRAVLQLPRPLLKSVLPQMIFLFVIIQQSPGKLDAIPSVQAGSHPFGAAVLLERSLLLLPPTLLLLFFFSSCFSLLL